eukprot:CAMPEP_0118927966 /NCGR_PEP_ID=MMETSP1169-20130426/5335_1 /TAXON_ID=36882 /ORGANISM="Pyramimonas obovata, Strain CCMP722" /LENGTH=314 /DNA_ID=CAMNT_0006869849 /DNA_START=106 /DNA_END=1050 /DNA_ORIENTATION=-
MDKRGGGDRGGGGKRKKARYCGGRGGGGSSAVIPHGVQGFFFSCENGRENKTAAQLMQVLDEFYVKLCPSAAKKETEEAAVHDIQASLEAEISDLREKKDARFTKIDHETGKGLGFIKMAPSEEGPSVQDLAKALVQDVKETKEKKCRFLMRILPVANTCFPSKDLIEKNVKSLVDEHFPTEEGVTPVKFSVVLEVRAFNSIPKNEIIDLVAQMVPKPHKVDLSNPEKSLSVFIIKNICLLGVVYEYHSFFKYNCNVLAMSEEERAEMCRKTTAPGTAPGPSKKAAAETADKPTEADTTAEKQETEAAAEEKKD